MTEDKKFNTRKQKSFDYAAEVVKQLITLSVGLLAFTVTFSKEGFIGSLESLSCFNKTLLAMSWICYLISIGTGIFALSTLTGQFTREEINNTTDTNPTIRKSAFEFQMRVQQLIFFIGFFYLSGLGIRKLQIPFIENIARCFVNWKTIIIWMVILLPLLVILVLFIIQKINVSKESRKPIRAYYYTTDDNKEKIRYIGEELKPKTLLWMHILEENAQNPFPPQNMTLNQKNSNQLQLPFS